MEKRGNVNNNLFKESCVKVYNESRGGPRERGYDSDN